MASDSESERQFLEAVASDDRTAIQRQLADRERRVSPALLNRALDLAAQRGHHQLVWYLIGHYGQSEYLVMMEAIERGSRPLVQLLAERPCWKLNHYAYQALTQAAKHHQREVFFWLAELVGAQMVEPDD